MANLSTFYSAVSLARACNLPSAKYLVPVQLTAAAGFQAPSAVATQCTLLGALCLDKYYKIIWSKLLLVQLWAVVTLEPRLLGSTCSNCFPPPSDIKTAAQPRWDRRYQPRKLKCCWQTCWHACTASDFLTEAPVAILAGLFRAVWTSWWYSYLGIFFWNWGLSAKCLLIFEETHGERCCLQQSKCCITGSCNWSSFLQAARDSWEIINNWEMIVPDEGNSCCRDAVLLSWLWLAGFGRGGKKSFLTHQKRIHTDLTQFPHFWCMLDCGIKVTAKSI